MAAPVKEIVRVSPGVHWHALEDDEVVGRGYAFHRPDGRVLISVDTWRDDVFTELAEALVADLGTPAYTVVAADDREVLGRWAGRGFVDHRREIEYAVPTAGGAAPVPAGFTIVAADRLAEDELRALDQAVRQDIPGSEGWVNAAAAFRRHVLDPRFFDPATCLVALLDGERGEVPAGLVRVTTRARRLVLIGVRPEHRRLGLGRALLAAALGPVAAAGVERVHAEADETATAARGFLTAAGGVPVGGLVELVRR